MFCLLHKATKKMTLGGGQGRGWVWAVWAVESKPFIFLTEIQVAKRLLAIWLFISDIVDIVLQIKSNWMWKKTGIELVIFNNAIQSLQLSINDAQKMSDLKYMVCHVCASKFWGTAGFTPCQGHREREREREWVLSTAVLIYREVSIAFNHESFFVV